MQTNVVDCDVIDVNLDNYRTYIFVGKKTGKFNNSLPILKGLQLNIISGQCENTPKFGSNENCEYSTLFRLTFLSSPFIVLV